MTVSGNGESLQDVEVPDQYLLHSGFAMTAAREYVETLFAEVISDEIAFDTTTGVVSFTHRNESANMANGRAERNYLDWVTMRFVDMDIPESHYDLTEIVVNGLNQRIRESIQH